MIRSHLTILLAIAPFLSQAGGSKADYARADKIRSLTSGKVHNERLSPNWIGATSKFWYRAQNPDGSKRIMLVDPEKATRTKIDKPPVSKANNGTTVNVLRAPRGARRKGGDTEITFVNKTKQPVTLLWVSSRKNTTPYGTVAPGKSRMQHTFAGHVWLARGANGAQLGIYEAIDASGTAVIDGSWKPANRSDKNQRRNQGDNSQPRPQGPNSPDGKWRVSIDKHNLALTNTKSKKTSTLTTSGTEANPFRARFYWSPDSKKLIVIQEKQAPTRTVHIVQSAPKDQLQPKLDTFGYNKPGDPLDQPRPRLFDIATQKQIPVAEDLFPDSWGLSQFRWDLDSSRFTFLYNQRGHQVLRLIAIDAKNGKTSTVVEEAPDTFVCYSSKSFYAPLDRTDELIWMSERDGWNHLYLFDAKSGDLKNQITSGRWVVRRVDLVDYNTRQIWFQAGGIHPDQDPYHVHYARIDFDGKNLTLLTHGDGTHSIDYSPDKTHYIDTYSRVDMPPVHELRRSTDGSLVTLLETADASALAATGWQKPERFVAKGRDGKTNIYGVIFRPTTFASSNKYPVVEQIYAGPHSSHVPKRWSSMHGAQAFSELGFVLVQIDGMGTSNRSKAFHDVCWQNIGDAGFPDRVAWIKAAAKDRPYMDTSRVGIFGGSAGGQNAMRALIAHNDFYHVAVADCGCHDNRMDKIWWNEQWMGYPIADHYAASSNVDQAHRMQGDLLLIVGELDHNVDPTSTMQVVDALVKADKDFDLLVIPGAGHGAAGTPYGRRRQRDFLVRHLLKVEPRH
jgi:dipeptidyl-peptidase-4